MENVILIIKENPNFFTIISILLLTAFLISIIHRISKSLLKNKNKQKGIKKIAKLEHPLLIIIIIGALQAVIATFLRNYPKIHTNTNNLLVSISIIIITYMLCVIGSISLERWNHNIKKTRDDETHEGIIPLLKSVINIVLCFIALIFILQVWGIAVGALLTSLGIAGVILGFAFRDTLTNIFGGISLVLDDTFRKGDLIELSDGELGHVMETSLRSTKIKNFDLEEVYIPNSVLANTKITNYAQPTKSIRLKIIMPVAIGTDVNKVEKLILKNLEKREDILKYPKPKFFFVKVADYYLELMIGCYINDYKDLFIKKSEITKYIYSLLLQNKVEIPVPARKIYNQRMK